MMHSQPKLGCRKRAGEMATAQRPRPDSAENAAWNMKLSNTVPVKGPVSYGQKSLKNSIEVTQEIAHNSNMG